MPDMPFCSLADIWKNADDKRPAAIEADGRLMPRRDLFHMARALLPMTQNKRVAIFCSSTKLETSALLAAMRNATSIILPPNGQRDALLEIAGVFDILLCDTDYSDEIAHINIRNMKLDAIPAAAEDQVTVDLNKSVLFFTSGSTGAPKEIVKYLYQMDNEVREWEQILGPDAKDAEIHATVSHQHIYGLLFRILWPLCTARPFASAVCANWEEVIKTTKGRGPFILFSSPTHLCRLDGLKAATETLRPVFTFSSGGNLPDENAKEAAEILGGPIQEIYGSTETGGVARRFSIGENASWQALPTVELSQDDRGCLTVRSDFLSKDEPVFQMEDLVEIHGKGRFDLKGRADRIVKIEGKRTSLPRVEDLLRRHHWVQDVHVKALASKPPILGAAVELSAEGSIQKEQMGAFRLSRELRKYLATFEDAVTGPRRWRFPARLPRNAQGKLSAADMDQLFQGADEDANSPKIIDFVEISRVQDGDRLEITFEAPANLEYFKGHFTDAPLLPGVVQVHWAVQHAKTAFAGLASVTSVDKLKFKHFIFPEIRVILSLERTKENQIHFRYYSAAEQTEPIEHSSGILKFGDLD